MSSNSYLLSIPKLKGRENYSEWAFAVENFLVLEGMLKCIKPDLLDPPTVEPADDEKSKAKMVLSIDPALYIHVKELKTSKELWDKLKGMFDDSGFTRRISLLRTLISIRLDNCVSMTSYVNQIIETGQKLNGTGFNISNEWIGSLLLAGLSEKYAPMIMAIEHSGIQITTDAIKTKLLDMDSDANETGGAFANFRQNNYKKDFVKDTINPSTSKYNKSVKCYKCKKFGHYKNQCSDWKQVKNQINDHKQTNAFSAVFLSGSFDNGDWYIDSGASVHLTAREDCIKNRSNKTMVKEIVIANKEKLSVLCSGDVLVKTIVGKSTFDIWVKDAMCVPELTTNLLSVSQLISKGNTVKFGDDGCKIFNSIGDLVATAYLVNGVYKLNTPNGIAASAIASGEIWHRRLGHINGKSLNEMQNAVEGLQFTGKSDFSSDFSKSSCTVCCEGKQARLPFPDSKSFTTDLLQIVHTDLCGPMENVSLGGSKYFILFIDDFSRFSYIYFLKNKDDSLKVFKQFKAEVENQLNRSIKILRSDNGLEYCNKEFDNYLSKLGIIHQKSNVYTPQQNGLAERFNRTVVEKARCLLFDANLHKRFWAEATHTAVYIINRSLSSHLKGKTPFEIWTGKKPDISHLRIFGSSVMVFVPKEKRKKWDKKSIKCLLVGYPSDVKGFRVYNPETNKIFTSRDVIVMENPRPELVVEVNPPHTEVPKIADSVGENQSEEKFQPNLASEDLILPDEIDDKVNQINETINDSEHALPKRVRRAPDRYGWIGFGTGNCEYDMGDVSLEDALNGPEKERWLEAVQDELKCFDENNAWELVDDPKSGTIVECKWVLKKKYDSENQVRYRARLVAKGFTQKEGIDYVETFSPVVRHTTLRLLFALSAKLGLDVTHLDVKTAFLNGDLEETIYMRKPECLNINDQNKVLKLNKAIYGLKQASRAWYKKVDACLLKLGYKKSKLEPCMFIKNTKKGRNIVTLYVDDFFIFSDDLNETINLKKVLSNQFKLKDLGPVKQCLGMSVNIDKEQGEITLSQSLYIEHLLEKFNMVDCKTADTPIEISLKIEKGQGAQAGIPFQRLIGSLMYLAVLTRPDIAFSVNYLSQFNNCYTDEHWSYAKRILKYLKRTKNFGLKYLKESNSEITGFVDADWASNHLDRKSYTGYCFKFCGSVISWECKKQKTVALSSTEAEYMGITEACKEAIYLRNLEFEIRNKTNTIVIYNDNQSAQKLSANPIFHKRSKHIDVKYHFCRDCISDKLVTIKYLPTTEMPADLLTKGLCSKKHYIFMNTMGIINIV